jgi:nucleoside-diphosphate-sugar epimerase
MKIFVAGATGVVGRLLLPILIRAGHEVIGMTHSEEKKGTILDMGARAIVADALDREEILTVIDEVRPEVVIHQLTSLSSRNFSDNTRIRMEGTRNLVDASLAAGVNRIIAQSISFAYEPGDNPATEEVPLDIHAPMPRRTTIDGVAALEKIVTEIPHYVILRYGLLYGPDSWYDMEGFMADQVRLKQLPATDGVSSFLHTEDAANAALLALDWPSGPVNIVDDEPASGMEWLPVYASALGAPKPDVQPGQSNRGERGASNAKARREYGWKPFYPTWRTGFAQSLTSK